MERDMRRHLGKHINKKKMINILHLYSNRLK